MILYFLQKHAMYSVIKKPSMLLLSTPLNDLKNTAAFADKRLHLSLVEDRQWHAYK